MTLTVLLYAAAIWLLGDFLSGVVHWWEDRYGDPEWPVIGPLVVAPNIEHHTDQLAFTRGGYWRRNWTAIVPATLAAAGAAWAGWWILAWALVVVGQANEIHAWSHQRCSRIIRGLQLLGILQSPMQHAEHHRQPFDRNYCTVSDLLNPVLSAVGWWPAVEFVIGWLANVWPREEREVA